MKLIQEPKADAPDTRPKTLKTAPSAVTPSAIQLRIAREARRQARFEEVRILKQQGVSRNAIARCLQMSVNTEARYLRADAYPLRQANPATVSKAEAYGALLQQHWQTGCRSSRQLWTAIRERGFTGSESSVRCWLNHAQATGQLMAVDNGCTGPPPSSPAKSGRVLSSLQAAWVLLRPPDELEDNEQDWLSQLKAICEPVSQLHELAQHFAQMVKQKVATGLVDWLQIAKSSGLVDLRNFAVGLQRDFDAVIHALTLPWSNGPTEGHVHRLKLIKRQMYGRAKFDLLRKRVLQAC